jgi:hypothetical protein
LKWPKIGFPSNLWLGARITDQRTADERIPHLLRVPAAVRWIDITPTSDIDLSRWFADVRQGEYMGTAHHARRPPKGWTRAINWVVVRGGDPVHLRSLRDQCQHAGVPFWCESAIDGKVSRTANHGGDTMTDLEKRAMHREPFTRDQLEDRYAMAIMADHVSHREIQALCESHMRVLMELEELLAAETP